MVRGPRYPFSPFPRTKLHSGRLGGPILCYVLPNALDGGRRVFNGPAMSPDGTKP